MLKNFNRRNNQFKQDKEAAKSLVNTGESSYDSSLNVEELAAYTVTANVLLNLDQVLTKIKIIMNTSTIQQQDFLNRRIFLRNGLALGATALSGLLPQ